MTTQTYSDSEVMDGLQNQYADWYGPGPFSFENVYGRLDELDELTRDQFDRFVAELNVTRCGLCGIDCGSSMCEDDLDKIESDRYAAEFDRARAARK
jgi:hypothetical protein